MSNVDLTKRVGKNKQDRILDIDFFFFPVVDIPAKNAKNEFSTPIFFYFRRNP